MEIKLDCSTCVNCNGNTCKEYGTIISSALLDCAGEGFEYYEEKRSKCDSEK